MHLQRNAMRIIGASTLMLSAGLLAGCSSLGVDTASNSVTDTMGNLLAYNRPGAPPLPPEQKPVQEVNCPTIEVQDGTAELRTYAGGNANANVRYQYSLGDTARECSVVGNQIAIKVGIEGRVLIGPMGSPGSFTAPIRIAIRHESEGKAILSKLYKVPVTVPAGATEAPFSLVSEPLMVPMVQVRADEDYTVVVGFDGAGNAEVGTVSHRKKRKSG
jgi:hypothetical protein